MYLLRSEMYTLGQLGIFQTFFRSSQRKYREFSSDVNWEFLDFCVTRCVVNFSLVSSAAIVIVFRER